MLRPMDSAATTPGVRVIIGVHWGDGTPRIRLRDDAASASLLVPARGLRLNYRTSPEAARHCVGHTPFRKGAGDHVDCGNHPRPGSRTCERCGIVDATFASNLHHAHTKDRAEIDPAIAEHLRQPNELYIAAFRDGSLKVGTTTAKRRKKRLTEQGAWAARIVAEAADGYAVRVIEDRVTADLELPQSVSIGRKLDGMAAPIPDATLAQRLDQAAAAVHTLVDTMADTRIEAAHDPWSFPGAEMSLWSGLHRYPLKLESGSHDVEILDMCGRMAALRRPGSADTFIADLGRLYGVELDLGDYESDELAVQDSLF